MIRFPLSEDEAVLCPGEFRAGGTDLQERRRLGLSVGDLVDLSRLPGLRGGRWLAPPSDGSEEASVPAGRDKGGAVDGAAPQAPAAGYTLGALTTLAELARDPELQAWYPGLAGVAGAGATPQVRAVATLGGNLLQRSRCWYYRSEELRCLKRGGESCLARGGDSYLSGIFERGPCIAPHPSTLAMVLLAYEAHVQLHGAPDCSIGELLGDGSDPARENSLEPGVLLRAVELPPPVPGQRWAYRRATGRQRAEWPLVEAMVLLELDGATILQARVVAGAVAPVPLRLPWVEEQLTGRKASQANLEAAAARASEGAAPLPGNRYKLELLVGTVLDCLEQAAGGA